MNADYNELSAKKKRYADKYMFTEPWSQYVNKVGINQTGIIVGFRKTPPSDLIFPAMWEGENVIYEVTGEIRPI